MIDRANLQIEKQGTFVLIKSDRLLDSCFDACSSSESGIGFESRCSTFGKEFFGLLSRTYERAPENLRIAKIHFENKTSALIGSEPKFFKASRRKRFNQRSS
ncbi:MAG TPA: hypothetical protein VMU69_31115 [Bradyrhizobium sp.]|nr:hypothetical protein [Bradyrhizobium sp.]